MQATETYRCLVEEGWLPLTEIEGGMVLARNRDYRFLSAETDEQRPASPDEVAAAQAALGEVRRFMDEMPRRLTELRQRISPQEIRAIYAAASWHIGTATDLLADHLQTDRRLAAELIHDAAFQLDEEASFSVADVAARFSLSSRQVRLLCHQGRFPGAGQVIIDGRLEWRVPPEALEAYREWANQPRKGRPPKAARR